MIARLSKPAGESVYRIKGTSYTGHMKWVAEHFPGGTDAFINALGDAALQKYFRQPFLQSTSYDIYPLVIAAHPCARALQMSPHAFVVHRARYQAVYDQSGVYKLLFRIVTPGIIAPRIPQGMAQYFNFGKTEVVNSDGVNTAFTFGPLPADLVPWFSPLFEGFIPAVIGQTGAKNVEVSTLAHTPAGKDAAGAPLESMTVTIRWG